MTIIMTLEFRERGGKYFYQQEIQWQRVYKPIYIYTTVCIISLILALNDAILLYRISCYIFGLFNNIIHVMIKVSQYFIYIYTIVYMTLYTKICIIVYNRR